MRIAPVFASTPLAMSGMSSAPARMRNSFATITPSAGTVSVSAKATQSTGGNHTSAATGCARPAALATSEATVVTHSTRKYMHDATRRMSAP
jgi:hypothetical protein